MKQAQRDTQTDRYIAINQDKKTAVVYEKTGEDLHTIYGSTLNTVIERRRNGRWI